MHQAMKEKVNHCLCCGMQAIHLLECWDEECSDQTGTCTECGTSLYYRASGLDDTEPTQFWEFEGSCALLSKMGVLIAGFTPCGEHTLHSRMTWPATEKSATAALQFFGECPELHGQLAWMVFIQDSNVRFLAGDVAVEQTHFAIQQQERSQQKWPPALPLLAEYLVAKTRFKVIVRKESNMVEMNTAVADFSVKFNAFKAENKQLLTDLAVLCKGQLDEVDEVLDDYSADLKSVLGADAANAIASDAEEAADAAIAEAEAWVTDNVSNSSIEDRIAAVLWLEGAKKGEVAIRASFNTQVV